MIKRPSWKKYFFDVCELNAMMSTCVKRQVGAIIVDPISKRILATGFNGAPAKVKHCTEDTCLRKGIPSGEQLSRCRACIHGDMKIKLLNGTSVAIKDLVGQEVWGYGYDNRTGKIIPILIKNIRMTKKSSTVTLTFNDNTTFKLTKDHKILMRGENYIQADNIKIEEDSIMPGKWKNSTNPWFEGYEEIFHPLVPSTAKNQQITLAINTLRYLKCNNIEITEENYELYRNRDNYRVPTINRLIKENYIKSFEHLVEIEENCVGEYQLTHKVVADFCGIFGQNIHHIDFSKTNNEPANLIGLSLSEHTKLHPKKFTLEQYRLNGAKGIEAQRIKYLNDPVFRKKKSDHGRFMMHQNWNNPKFREKMMFTQSQNGKINVVLMNTNKATIKKRNANAILKRINNLIQHLENEKLTSSNYEQMREKYSLPAGHGVPFYQTILNHFPSVEEAIEKAYNYNHTLKSKSYSDEEVPVYDFEVDIVHNALFDLGNNTGIFLHNCHGEMNCLVQASKYGIPVNGMDMYCTHKPCSDCLKLLINAGIKTVYYKNDYPSDLTDQLIKEPEIEISLVHVKNI